MYPPQKLDTKIKGESINLMFSSYARKDTLKFHRKSYFLNANLSKSAKLEARLNYKIGKEPTPNGLKLPDVNKDEQYDVYAAIGYSDSGLHMMYAGDIDDFKPVAEASPV